METKSLAILLPSERDHRYISNFAVVLSKTQRGYWLRTEEEELRYPIYPEYVIIFAEGEWDDERPSEIIETLPQWAQLGLHNLKEEIVRLNHIADYSNA
jgi:hypothetical protein